MTDRITTLETRYLRDIKDLLRIIAGKLSSGSGVTILIAEFTVDGGGGAPANGDTTYANPVVTGSGIEVFKNGVGYLTKGTDYNILTGGGITLLGGSQFSTGEKYLIFKT